MKSRLPKTQSKTSSVATVVVTKPRKRIFLPSIKSFTTRAVKTEQNVSSIAMLFSPEEIYQLIEKKAYEIFEQRGYVHGHDLDDWLQAEQMIKTELNLI